MKALYWKTRPLRLTPTGGRLLHWPGLALNLALALVLVAVPVFGFVLIDLEFNIAEALPLWLLALPIVLTLGTALTALGFGFRLTAPLDCLPGENGEPPAQRTTRWFHWANLRAVFFGVLASITVLLLARTLSDWQGRRAWEAYRADAEKRGVVFDLEKLMPPPVPDAENFAATPLLLRFQSGTKEWREANASTNYSDRMTPPIRSVEAGIPKRLPEHAELWFLGDRTDLLAWQSYYRTSTNWPKWPQPRSPAEDVLKALSRYDAELAELRSAATRPRTQFNTHVTEDGVSTYIPYLHPLKSAGEVVRLLAVAELSIGKSQAAFADVNLMFRLADSPKDDPLLLSHIVRLALHTLALRTVWEGLADHRWSEAQLAHWQMSLAKLGFGVELRHAMAGERAFGNRAIDFLRRRPEMWPVLFEESEADKLPARDLVMHGVPAGWFYREQINYNRMFDDYFVPALPRASEQFDAGLMQAKSVAIVTDIERSKQGIKAALQHRTFSHILLPGLTGVMPKACRAQAFTQLAITACALERHWLARGSYPESLAALAPELAKQIPLDPISGQPFRYERTADGRFRLWSVGWNGKDDGGTVALTGTPASKSRNINFEQGDWVWPVPAK